METAPPTSRVRASRGRRAAFVACVLAVLVIAVASCSPNGTGPAQAESTTPSAPSSGSSSTGPGAPGSTTRPNVVFVLTDDLAMNLVQYLPHVVGLERAGTSFSNYTVTDSLCCPSRSSIFTGRFPHDTGIFTNGGSDGGFATFHARGEESSTFATSLQAAGYRTAMMGKYLNGYQPAATEGGTSPYVPPGWNEWDVAGNGYPEFNYDLNENHHVVHHGSKPSDYLTDVLSRKGASFISSSAAAKSPFLLEIATFAPHAPYTPAPRDARSFPGLKAPQTAAYDTLPADAPAWLASRAPLTRKEQKAINVAFRKRVQAVQAVDRMIANLESALAKAGVADDTDIVFSSDNGYHLGEYRLNAGKMTAFDTDIRVPLVVAGPGIPRNRQATDVVENIDLAETFEALGRARIPSDSDGRSLVPLLDNQPDRDWRTAALIEHHGPDTDRSDPDFPVRNSGNPPSYEALRTAAYTYVQYVDGSTEYYDRTRDPDELHNVVSTLSPARRSALRADLGKLQACHGQSACWAAGHLAR